MCLLEKRRYCSSLTSQVFRKGSKVASFTAGSCKVIFCARSVFSHSTFCGISCNCKLKLNSTGFVHHYNLRYFQSKLSYAQQFSTYVRYVWTTTFNGFCCNSHSKWMLTGRGLISGLGTEWVAQVKVGWTEANSTLAWPDPLKFSLLPSWLDRRDVSKNYRARSPLKLVAH